MKITVQNIAFVTPKAKEIICNQTLDCKAILDIISHHILFGAYTGEGEIVAHTRDNQPIEIFHDSQLVGVVSYSEQNPSTVKQECLFLDATVDSRIREILIEKSRDLLKQRDGYTEIL